MVIELNDFIHIYDNIVDSSICNSLINFFDKNEKYQEVVKMDKKPNFTQLNLTKNCNLNKDISNIHNYIISKILDCKSKYYESISISDICFPKTNSFEEIRIKKYHNNGEDEFDTHVDVIDYSSSRRFLSFLVYLNNVDVGGETLFNGLKILPRAGTVLVFPPLWMFPHKGNPPLSNDKYIMSTYLHYN